MEMMIRKNVSIRKDQVDIIDRHSLNFSKFVRDRLDDLEASFHVPALEKQEAKNADVDGPPRPV